MQKGYVRIVEENGLVEWLQITCLITECSILVIAAMGNFVFRELALLLAFFSAFAATRELDAILDVMVLWFGWKTVYVFLSCVIFSCIVTFLVLERTFVPTPKENDKLVTNTLKHNSCTYKHSILL